jgi:hypothetical protein
MRFVAAVLVFLAGNALQAQRFGHAGDRIRIQWLDGRSVVSRFVASTRDSVILDSGVGAHHSFYSRHDVVAVSLSRGRETSIPRTLVATGLGALAGAAISLRFGRCRDGPCAGALLAVPSAIAGSIVAGVLARQTAPERWITATLP